MLKTAERSVKANGRNRFSAELIKARKPRKILPRIIIHGVGGIGKTSLAAQFPAPIFIQSRGETGLETLQDSGLVRPDIAILPFTQQREADSGKVEDVPVTEAQNWQDVVDGVDFLTYGQHDYQTLVFDVINGAEKLLFEHVCNTKYGGDWGPTGFAKYQNGYDSSLPLLKEFTNSLDTLRDKAGMRIVMLAHSKVERFSNPLGSDYDKYVPELHKKVWSWLFGWSDMVLFANRIVQMAEEGRGNKAGKAKANDLRVLHTETTAAWDAKNRYGLEDDVSMGRNAKDAFQNLVDAMRAAKEANKAS